MYGHGQLRELADNKTPPLISGAGFVSWAVNKWACSGLLVVSCLCC